MKTRRIVEQNQVFNKTFGFLNPAKCNSSSNNNMNLEFATTIFYALLRQQQQQQQQYYYYCGVCDHSTGLHGSSSSSYSYSFAIIRNAAGRWMKAAGFLHSFLPSRNTCNMS